MVKYHISPSTGRPNQCHASVKACPVGGENEHYPTKEAAREAYERKQKASEVPQSLKKAGKSSSPSRYVKVQAEGVSPNKTWLVVKEDGGVTHLQEVRKNKASGEPTPMGEKIEVPTATVRDIKLRNRGSASTPVATPVSPAPQVPKREVPKPSPAPVTVTRATPPVRETPSAVSLAEEEESFDDELPQDEEDWGGPTESDLYEEPSYDDADDDEPVRFSSSGREGCEECGSNGNDVRWREDPYDRMAHGESNYRMLCNDCYEDRASY